MVVLEFVVPSYGDVPELCVSVVEEVVLSDWNCSAWEASESIKKVFMATES